MNPKNKTQPPPQRKCVAFHDEATADDPLLQKETVVRQNTFPMHSVGTNNEKAKHATSLLSKLAATTEGEAVFSAHKLDTERGDCKTKQSTPTPEQADPSILNIRDRGLQISRRLPETNLDPLSTFIILRSQPSVPVAAIPQHVVSTPGTLLMLLWLIWLK